MSDTTKGLVGPSLNLAESEIHGSDINEENYNADNSLLKIGHLSPQATDVLVKSGDRILLRKKETDSDSHSIPFTRYEKNIAGEITCNLPEILGSIQVGHRVYIDDGKISSVVRSLTDEHLELEILSPSGTTAKIKPEKRLNFPDSKGFNLAKILLAGLDLPNFGILIARGDLAVEVGFENLPAIQEDILCMCEAAQIPVILATQVLETMAKSGLPTRAEMIDAAFGQRAECVMLNKGKHILEAVKMLSLILESEERRHLKKRQIFREFTKQSGFP